MTRTLSLAAVLPLVFISTAGHAQSTFFSESKITLGLKNYYMNRTYINDTRLGYPYYQGEPKRHSVEWGQGISLGFSSGLTEGPVKFGLDIYSTSVIKLDSSSKNVGTGLFVYDSVTGETEDTSSTLGGLARMVVGKTTLSYGMHFPTLPVVYRSDARIFLQSFQGTQLVSRDLENTVFTLGRFESTKLRSSTDSEDMEMYASEATGGVRSNNFTFAGVEYQAAPFLKTNYFYGELEDNYSQHHFGLHGGARLGSVGLRADVMYFVSRPEGRTNVDNRLISSRVSASWSGHTLAAMWQEQSGRTGMPFIAGGTSPYTFNGVTFHHFLRANEDSWQARYDYDFAALGVPGLTFMTRYIKGKNFVVYGRKGDEWERNTDVAYHFQGERLKGLSVQYRNVSHRSDVMLGIDDHRLIINYSTSF